MIKSPQNAQRKINKLNEYKTLIVAAPDFVGRLVGRRLNPALISGGRDISVDLCSSVLAWDVEQNPIDGLNFAGFHTGWQDLVIKASTSSLRPLSWLENTGLCIGDLYTQDKKLVDFSPREILKNQIMKLEQLGLRATVATELEFYLVLNSASEHISDNKRHDYVIDLSTNKMEKLFQELCDSLSASGVSVSSWQSEWGLGQWEVNMVHGHPLETADSHVIFKLAIKDLADKYGYEVNFMAKPYSDQVGSSCHIHISLQNNSGSAEYFEQNLTNSFSQNGIYSVGGILNYLEDCLPLYAGNINSYKRVIAREFCGSGKSWGFDNRTASCRVVGHSPSTMRIEFRLPGADCNPYLALAGLLASVRRGIEKRIIPPKPVTGDATKIDSGTIPSSLEKASSIFSQSSFVKEEFGQNFASQFSCHLKHEVDQFQLAVTDWEARRYGKTL